MSYTADLAALLTDPNYTVYQGQAPDDAPAPFLWVAPLASVEESRCLNLDRGPTIDGWQIQIVAATLAHCEDLRDLVLTKNIGPWWYTDTGPMFPDNTQKPALIVIPLFAERTNP